MKNDDLLIIGGGSIGQRHLRNLLSLGEKNIFVVEPDEIRAKAEIGDKYQVGTFRSLSEAFSRNKFKVVFICSPSIFHLEQAIYCAERDCDLFIEKPLSHSLDGMDKLASVVEKRKLIVMVGSNWKFHPLFKKLKAWLDAGAIGKILSARCQFGSYLPDWHPWEDYRRGYSANKKLGGGAMLDAHEFDYISWFLGKAKKVICITGKVSNLEIDVEDVAEVIIQFESGAIGEVHVDYVQRFYRRNWEFFGELGTIDCDCVGNQATLRKKDQAAEVFQPPSEYDLNEMYVEEVKHFLDCVKNRKSSVTPLLAGKMAIKIISAAKESAASDRAVDIV